MLGAKYDTRVSLRSPGLRSLTLRLTEMAEADLAEIWFYVAGGASEATATRLIDRIKDFESLAFLPQLDHMHSVDGNAASIASEKRLR